jgi:hypothetical protein
MAYSKSIHKDIAPSFFASSMMESRGVDFEAGGGAAGGFGDGAAEATPTIPNVNSNASAIFTYRFDMVILLIIVFVASFWQTDFLWFPLSGIFLLNPAASYSAVRRHSVTGRI